MTLHTPHAAAAPPARAGAAPYVPTTVLDLELADSDGPRHPDGSRAVAVSGPVLALVRFHGHPLGLLQATLTGDPARANRELADAAGRELAAPIARHRIADHTGSFEDPDPGREVTAPRRAACRCLDGRAEVLAEAPYISVVIATRDRPGLLRNCLDSVLRVDYPSFEVIVVDNAPGSDATARLVRDRYAGKVRYLCEPVAGGARAHNRGLAAAAGEIMACTDDDTLVDRSWLAALAESFAGSGRIGCVTGLILPAELETATQAALTRHADFAKGFAPRSWSLGGPVDDPLFPFNAGRFGSGANAAYRTGLLRALGGFDLATGPGTPAQGGEDLLAFFRALVSGHTLAYQPDALVWHCHKRTPDAVPAQAFGYGAGFGAYLTAAVAHEPQMLPALARRLPRGVAFAAARARGRQTGDGVWSRRLSVLELQGLLYGPLGYLRALNNARRQRVED